MGSTLGVKYVLLLALRSQILNFLRVTCYRHTLEYLQVEPARSVKKWKKKKGLFIPKRLTVTDLFEGPWLVGTRFRR